MQGEPRADSRKIGGLTAREREWLTSVVAELLQLRREKALSFEEAWEVATAHAGGGGALIGFTREACRSAWGGAQGADLRSAIALLDARDEVGRQADGGRVIA